MHNKNIELLAPVGSMESLYAAIQNGCNAVYLGGKVFSARKYANNFDYDELEEAVRYAHLRNVRVYVTVNTIIDNSELDDILEYVKFLYNIDVDALIVQDLGFAYLVKNLFPDFELHGSTQMTINNLPGAIFLEKNGFERIVLARETPIEEIRLIDKNSHIELEDFVHGALCVCYSGQCLMSSMIGGRSGNRGACAQPCRMEYEIIDYRTKKKVGALDKGYFLSSKDLNTIDNLDEIIDSGIVSLKIEGRMKRPEYVATVVSKYRKALDNIELDDKDKKDIKQIFNRDFTKGNILGDFGPDYISYKRPDNRGLYIGSVVDNSHGRVKIRLEEDINEADGLEIESSRDENFGLRWNYNAGKGDIVELKNIRDIELGAKVYRTSDRKLLEESRDSYRGERIKYPLDIGLSLKKDQHPKISCELGGISLEVQTDFVVQEARKTGLTEERIIEQISKLKDTVYSLGGIDIDMDDNIFMPVSELNELRRRLVDELDTIRSNHNGRNYMKGLLYKKENFIEELDFIPRNKLSVSVSNIGQFKQLDLNKLDRIYLGFYDGLEEALDILSSKDIEVYLDTDKILYNEDLEEIKNRINRLDGIDGIVANNTGTVEFVRDNFGLKIHGGEGLNIFNPYTSEFYKKEGVDTIALSHELTLKQISNITSHRNNIYETMVYGYIPVMVNRSCPMSILKGCKDDSQCEICNFKKGYGLRDRKNKDFYLERRNGNTIIYNTVPLMVLDSLDEIGRSNISYMRLDFSFEEEGIKDLQKIYYDYIKGHIDKGEVIDFVRKYKKEQESTKGHYFRGIM